MWGKRHCRYTTPDGAPSIEPRPASLVVTRWWPVLKPEKTAALIHPSARKGFFRKFERRGFSELLLSPRTSMLSAGLTRLSPAHSRLRQRQPCQRRRYQCRGRNSPCPRRPGRSSAGRYPRQSPVEAIHRGVAGSADKVVLSSAAVD